VTDRQTMLLGQHE